MKHLHPSPNRKKGSALIAVFWMIAIMGMVVFAGAKALDADTSATRTLRGRTFAKHLAQMGIEVARHPAIQMDDGLLHYTSPDGGGYDVQLSTEEARLNINVLLTSGDQILLPRLFASWGLKPQQISALQDALRDWVDEDDHVSMNGAEKSLYEKAGFDGMPLNRPFKKIEEMLMVRGMSEINTLRPDWRDWFTIHGDGRVDVNNARAELIALIANVPIERVTPLLNLRVGGDGTLHTRDDHQISSAVQVAQLLGVYQPQTVEALTRWIQFSGPTRRIECIGYYGDVRRRLVLILQNHQALWRGEFPIYGSNL